MPSLSLPRRCHCCIAGDARSGCGFQAGGMDIPARPHAQGSLPRAGADPVRAASRLRFYGRV